MNQCPKCQSKNISSGSMYEGGGRWGQSLFRPEGLRRWTLLPTGGVPAAEPFRACLDCGLLWSLVSPDAVKQFIASHGTDETKKLHGL